jgi:hypothetical protein
MNLNPQTSKLLTLNPMPNPDPHDQAARSEQRRLQAQRVRRAAESVRASQQQGGGGGQRWNTGALHAAAACAARVTRDAQVFVALLLDANINIRCKAAGALQSLAVHPSNQQVPPACASLARAC